MQPNEQFKRSKGISFRSWQEFQTGLSHQSMARTVATNSAYLEPVEAIQCGTQHFGLGVSPRQFRL
jgi:hypothetical protein